MKLTREQQKELDDKIEKALKEKKVKCDCHWNNGFHEDRCSLEREYFRVKDSFEEELFFQDED